MVKKLLIVVSLLITCALGIQAFISTHIVGAELERSVTANMTAKAQATTESFDGLLQAAASQEQSSGIEEVNKAIMQMDDMTQQNAALVEQSAAASESMNEQASGMKKMMDFFRLDAAAVQAVAGKVTVEGLDVTGIDFGAPHSKHLIWKSRLRRFLDGKESMHSD